MAKVGDFENKHRGERIVIAGNGHSLLKMDLKKINCPTFGVNRIYLHRSWQPTYYCTESKKFCEKNWEHILRYEGPRFKFVANRCSQYLTTPKLGGWQRRCGKRLVWVNMPKRPVPVNFSTCCHQVVCHGMNVVYMAMQLAFYMGAQEVVLIGVDFDYPDGQVAAKHFYGSQLQPGEVLDTSHKAITIEHYKYAHTLFNSGSKPRIVNATPGSKLKVFPLVKFEDLF